MPQFLNMMVTETSMKVQTHVVSTVINFAKGLLTEDEEGEDETSADSAKLMETYSKALFENLIKLLQNAMAANYEPLQEEVMNLLSVIAAIIEKEFAKYYSVLMPIMLNILTNVPMKTMPQMTLRARTIEAIGFMIEAVTDERAAFLSNVTEITQNLVTMLINGSLTNDDPQQAAIKDTLAKIAGFLKEDFQQFVATLLPTLVADTKVDIDIKMESAEMPKTTENHGFITLISENMGTAFAPFAEVFIPIATENTTYKYSSAIRKFSLKTLNNTLVALGLPHSVTLFNQFFTILVKNI